MTEETTLERRVNVPEKPAKRGKTFILDTNIILDNPDCVYEFLTDKADTVVILDTVLGELDRKKSESGFLGRHARHFSNMLEKRTRRKTDLQKLFEEGFILWSHQNGKDIQHGKITFYSPADKGEDPSKLPEVIRKVATALQDYNPSLELKLNIPSIGSRTILQGLNKVTGKADKKDQSAETQVVVTSNIGDLFSRLTRAFDIEQERRKRLRFTPDLGPKDIEMLQALHQYTLTHPDELIEFITNDTNLALTARINGITASHRKYETFDLNKIYQGMKIIKDDAFLAELISAGLTKPGSEAAERGYEASKISEGWMQNPVANEYFVFLTDQETEEQQRLEGKGGKCVPPQSIYRYDALKRALMPMTYDMNQVLGFKPKNLEQQIMFDLAMIPQVQCITSIGPAGTGKTFIALLLALNSVHRMRKQGNPDATVLVTKRSVNVAGEEYGFIPGDLNEKTIDNFSGIAANYYRIMKEKNELNKAGFPPDLPRALKAQESYIELKPIGFMRGASLTEGEVLIIDEAQNVEPRVMETLLTRVGEGKVWVVGDTYQPDNPLTREDYNGLLQISDMMTRIDDPELAGIFGLVNLRGIIRGKLANAIVKYWRSGGNRTMNQIRQRKK